MSQALSEEQKAKYDAAIASGASEEDALAAAQADGAGGDNVGAEKDARIAELEAALAAAEAEAASPDKDAQIADLTQQLETLRTQVAAGGMPIEGVPGTVTAPQPVPAVKNPSPGLDVGQAEVQSKMDAETDLGYRDGSVQEVRSGD